MEVMPIKSTIDGRKNRCISSCKWYYTFSEFLAQPFYFFSIFFDGSVIVLNGFLLLLKDRPDRLNPFTDFILVTRGSIEPHYDWVVKMTINANPCPTWV